VPESVTEATRSAETAQRKYLELQHAALHAEPESRPSAADVLAASHAAELAQQRIDVARRREAGAREAARVEAMAALGGRVEELAEAAKRRSSEHSADLAAIAELAGRVRARAAAHDEAVRALHAEAGLLFADPRNDVVVRTGQPGEWAAHMPPQGLRHGTVGVHVFGGAVGLALEAATRGDVAGAAKRLDVVDDYTPQAPTQVYVDTVNGSRWPIYGAPLPRSLQMMVSDGRARPLTDSEMDEYLAAWWQRQQG
jgi:hypothetical protein